jgi:peptide-methionine (S)-S-oxide reductase
MGDHTEAFALDFDPRLLSYDDLLEMFWADHRPGRAGYSRQYMAAAFPTATQVDRAHASRDRIAARIGNVETPIVESARFYLAEDYHQKYYLRHDRLLMAELDGYSPSAFVDSTVAARLNAYAAGHGSRAQLDTELEDMALSPAAADHLRARMGRRRFGCA